MLQHLREPMTLPDWQMAIAAFARRNREFLRFDGAADAARLWVVFSHVDVPAGKFAQSHVLEPLEGAKLFVNCDGNSWYRKGIRGVARSLGGLIDEIVTVTADAPSVRFVGHSMGAYLSLLAGNLVAGSDFLSTSPEPTLALPGSRSDRNGVSGEGWEASVAGWRTRFHGSPNGAVLFGAFDPVDCYFLADEATHENLGQVVEVPHHHGVTEFLTSNRVYRDLLEDPSAGLASLSARGFVSAPFTHGSADQYRHFYQTFDRFRQGEDRFGLRAMVLAHGDWTNPGWQHLRAKVWHRLGQRVLALEAAEAAWTAKPDLMEYLETYARSCAQLKEAGRLCRLYDSLQARDFEHPVVKRVSAFVAGHLSSVHRVAWTQPVRPVDMALPGPQRRTGPAADPAQVAHFKGLATDQRWDDLLRDTGELGPEAGCHPEIQRLQAVAMVRRGNRQRAIPLLLEAVSARPEAPRLTATLADIAVRTSSSQLITGWLSRPVPDEVIRQAAGRLVACLPIFTDPAIAIPLMRKLARAGVDFSDGLEKLAEKMRAAQCFDLFVQRLANQFSAASLPQPVAETTLDLLIRSGHRTTARSWAASGNAGHGEGWITHVASVLDPLVPQAGDSLSKREQAGLT